MARLKYDLTHLMDEEQLSRAPKILKAEDEEQGRIRLVGAEMDALTRTMVGISLISTGLDGLDRRMKQTKTGRLKSHMAGMIKELRKLTDCIAQHQLRTMFINLDQVSVTVDAMPRSYAINLPYEAAAALADAATRTTCSFECDVDARTAKTCMLRKALDCIGGIESDPDDLAGDHCPYMFSKVDRRRLEDIRRQEQDT